MEASEGGGFRSGAGGKDSLAGDEVSQTVRCMRGSGLETGGERHGDRVKRLGDRGKRLGDQEERLGDQGEREE